MCGRYTLFDSDTLAERFAVPRPSENIRPNYNVAPGQYMPVITENDDGRQLEIMKWGLVPGWAKDKNIGYKLINARSESLFEKPAWRTAVKRRRCLVPADGFYEWQKLTSASKAPKQPYYIHPKTAGLFAFAGVWDSWKDPDGNDLQTYSIITTEPNADMRALHDRMPVILYPETEAAWLSPANNDRRNVLESLLHPYHDNGLELFPVSREVNVTANNDARLIYPMNPK
ncbi:MAG TPA: SOS response-associated peptidase [Candidatus Saccharimonadales bacterium]|nr:SOS response-associated peptidase [Candidatus Saccharimonadales bacterium]